MKTIAVLITCHNRKYKTLACLSALYKCFLLVEYSIDVYLVDDGSIDGTKEAIKNKFPLVNIIKGNGNLFWAGGMRLAWTEALKLNFDGYLLLNDDTLLFPNAVLQLINTHIYSMDKHKQGGIYVGTTIDPNTNNYSYGGHKLLNRITGKSCKVKPSGEKPQTCDFANANILYISKNVVESIGILSSEFTHSLADYDYTLTAKKNGFPMLVCANYCGSCINDHGDNWLSGRHSLSERIRYLKNPKYLAYNEYLYYIKCHFPFYLPVIFIKLWFRTFFPSILEKFKNNNVK